MAMTIEVKSNAFQSSFYFIFFLWKIIKLGALLFTGKWSVFIRPPSSLVNAE